jgi:hypothetical protein
MPDPAGAMTSRASSNPLPHGAKGLALVGVALVVARDKLVFSYGDRRSHLTLHAGHDSRVLDLHRTSFSTDGTKIHRKLFSITHENLSLLLRELEPEATRSVGGLLHGLRIGWMARSRMAAIVGLPPSDADLGAVTIVRDRKLVVDPGLLAANCRVPEFLDELLDLPNGAGFTVLSCAHPGPPRPLGLGFKYSDRQGRVRLAWMKYGDAVATARRLLSALSDAAVRYGEFHEPLPWF